MKRILAWYPSPPAYACLAPNGQVEGFGSLPIARRTGGTYIKWHVSTTALLDNLEPHRESPLTVILPKVPDGSPRNKERHDVSRALHNLGLMEGVLAACDLDPTWLNHEVWQGFIAEMELGDPSRVSFVEKVVALYYPPIKLKQRERSTGLALLYARWEWLRQQNRAPKPVYRSRNIKGGGWGDSDAFGGAEDWL